MKKTTTMAAVVFALILTLTACGGDSGSPDSANTNTSKPAQETTGGAPTDSQSTAPQVAVATFFLNSITLEAPASWTEELNDVSYGTEVMRLQGAADDGTAIVMEVGYHADGNGTLESTKKSLALFYADLQEAGDVTIGGNSWAHLTATTRKDGSAMLYNGYFTQFAGKPLLIDFRGLPENDPRIDAILTSVKTK